MVLPFKDVLLHRNGLGHPIGILSLNNDGSISGGSANEVRWTVSGNHLQFLDENRAVSSTFQLTDDMSTIHGEYLFSWGDNNERLKHILRPLGNAAAIHKGLLPNSTDDISGLQSGLSDNKDFSFVVAKGAHVNSSAKVLVFDDGGARSEEEKAYYASDSYEADPVFFHVLHNARVYNGGIIAAESGSVISETAYQANLRSRVTKYSAWEFGPQVYLPRSDRISHLPGTWCLFNTLLDNYAHFHVQSAINAKMADLVKEASGLEEIGMICTTLPGKRPSEHQEAYRNVAIERFGYNAETMFNPLQEAGVVYVVDRLIVPSTHAIPPEMHFNPWIVSTLREKLLRNDGTGDKLYILSRADVGSRRNIANFDELEKELAELGFESIVIGNLPYDQQVSILADAKMIISPHGGNMTNMVSHPGGLKVLELTQSSSNAWFKNLANLCGHTYGVYCTRPFGSETQWYSSFVVDPKVVRSCVVSLLES